MKTGKLTCVGCLSMEDFEITSSVTPTLSMCELAKKISWSYQEGFFSMMTGNLRPRCPRCTKEYNDAAAARKIIPLWPEVPSDEEKTLE